MAKKKQQQNNVAEKPKKRSLLGLLFMPFGLVLAHLGGYLADIIGDAVIALGDEQRHPTLEGLVAVPDPEKLPLGQLGQVGEAD